MNQWEQSAPCSGDCVVAADTGPGLDSAAEIDTELAAPLEFRTPTGTGRKRSGPLRVRMEAGRNKADWKMMVHWIELQLRQVCHSLLWHGFGIAATRPGCPSARSARPGRDPSAMPNISLDEGMADCE